MLVTSYLTRDFTYHFKRTSNSSCYLIGYLVQHGQSKHMYDKSAIFTLMHALLLSVVAYFIYLLWIVINFNVTPMSKTPGKTKQNTVGNTLSNDTCFRSRPSRISTHFVRRARVKCQYSTGPTVAYGTGEDSEEMTAADTWVQWSTGRTLGDSQRIQMCE